MMSPPQGAATSVWAAAGKVWEGKGGKYLSNCSIATVDKPSQSALSITAVAHAYSPEDEDKLWELSAKLVGFDEEV
jgi:hypothetical protein